MKKFFGLWMAIIVCVMPASAAWYGPSAAVDYSFDAASSYYCAVPSGSPVTTQAGVSISSPTLALFNPTGSGKNLVVLDTEFETLGVPGSPSAVFLAFNQVTSSAVYQTGTVVTAPIITPALVGKSTGTLTNAIGQCTVMGFLPAAPKAFRYIGFVSTGTTVDMNDMTQGKVVIPPGAGISIQTTGAVQALAHIIWREDNQ